MKLAVFGGSFDPVHRGHAAMVDMLLERDLADEIIMLPAARSPFKQGHSAAGEHRLAMLELVFGRRPRVRIDARELGRPGPSRTVDTLEALAGEFPDARLSLVVGLDNIPDLHRWHEVGRVLALVDLIVFPRGEAVDDGPAQEDIFDRLRTVGLAPRSVTVVTGFHEPVSSRSVRARLSAEADVTDLVPGPVAAYIKRHGLYSARP